MKYIYIYRINYSYEEMTAVEEEHLYMVVREDEKYFYVKNIKGFKGLTKQYDYLDQLNKKSLNLMENKYEIKIITEYEGMVKRMVLQGGFIYDDEENFHEERKILLKLDAKKVLKEELNKIIEKINKLEEKL